MPSSKLTILKETLSGFKAMKKHQEKIEQALSSLESSVDRFVRYQKEEQSRFNKSIELTAVIVTICSLVILASGIF